MAAAVAAEVALAVEAVVSTAAVVAAPALAAAVSMAARIIPRIVHIIRRITIIPTTDPIGVAGTLAVGIPVGTITAAVVASAP